MNHPVHTVSFDWFLSCLEFCLLKLLTFYQKLLWNIRSRLNPSTFWVFESIFEYWQKSIKTNSVQLQHTKSNSLKGRFSGKTHYWENWTRKLHYLVHSHKRYGFRPEAIHWCYFCFAEHNLFSTVLSSESELQTILQNSEIVDCCWSKEFCNRGRGLSAAI